MFSGIITERGRISAMEEGRLTVACGLRPAVGASVAVNGCCLTAANSDAQGFSADVMPETLRCTNLGSLAVGAHVNVEASLRLGDELGGHLVSGHVDSVGTVAALRDEGNAVMVRIDAPPPLTELLAAKGSVAVDGISLTVVDVADGWFTVSLIPHTREITTAGNWVKGSQVNLEADMLARYVHRALQTASSRGGD